MKTRFQISLLFILVIFSGCTSLPVRNLPTSGYPSTPEIGEQVSPTSIGLVAISSKTPDFTSTVKVFPTYSSSPPATSTIQPIVEAYPTCAGKGTLQDISSTFGFLGALVYYDYQDDKIMFAGGENFQVWDGVSDVIPEWMGFSPNGEWLAYVTWPPKFNLVSFQGERLETNPDPESLLTFFPDITHLKGIGWPAWVNDRLISMGVDKSSSGERPVWFMSFLNPFSGEWNLQDLYTLKGFNQYGRSIVSPDLSREFHFEPGSTSFATTLVLWDRENQFRLKEWYNFYNFVIVEGNPNDQVVWTADSAKVAIIMNNSLRILDRDGKELSRMKPGLPGNIGNLQWSPDGEQLAISWAESREVGPSHHDLFSSILIMEVESGKIVYACPVPDHLAIKELAWIGKGDAIAYQAENSKISPVVVLDLLSGISMKITDHSSLFGGWSAKFFK